MIPHLFHHFSGKRSYFFHDGIDTLCFGWNFSKNAFVTGLPNYSRIDSPQKLVIAELWKKWNYYLFLLRLLREQTACIFTGVTNLRVRVVIFSEGWKFTVVRLFSEIHRTERRSERSLMTLLGPQDLFNQPHTKVSLRYEATHSESMRQILCSWIYLKLLGSRNNWWSPYK